MDWAQVAVTHLVKRHSVAPIPDTALAAVDERPLMEEFEIKIPVDVFEQLIPITVPPVPEDVNPVIVFPLITEFVAPLKELPKLIPVIVP